MIKSKSPLKCFWIIIFLSTNLYAQKYDKTPIAISDIKRGIVDFEYLRAICLEKGFKFDMKDSDSEFWKVPVDEGNESTRKLFSQITIQASIWKFDGQPYRKVLYIQIRKDLLPRYNEIFFSQVTTSFPEKKAEPVTRIDNATKEEKEDYDLVYYSKDSDIAVQFEEDDTWAKYSFKLIVKRK